MEDPQIIDPRLWETNHLESHKALNFHVRKLIKKVDNNKEDIDDLLEKTKSNKNLSEVMIDKLSKELDKLSGELSWLQTTLNKHISEVKKHEVIRKTYTWIVDTWSVWDFRVDRILVNNKWQYKVEINNIEVNGNKNVESYELPSNDIFEWELELRIKLKSNGEKAVLRYSFSVLIYQL